MHEKLTRGDRRLIVACVLVSAVSLFVGVKYYFLAFPEASIEFRVTKDSSKPVAEEFLKRLALDPAGYRHAAVFGYADLQKTFLERELGVEESNKLIETTVRLWRWKHRWFRPLQKEELRVDLTTKGELVDFRHFLPEDAPGADLEQSEARGAAETFLAGTMGRPLDTLAFVEASTQKRPHRTDHSFTWKVAGSEVRGAEYRVEVSVAGSAVAGYGEYLHVPDGWVRDYEKLRSKNEIASQVDAVFLFLTILAMLVFLVLRIRRGDVRWRASAILGGLIFALLTVSLLNTLPSSLYGYDTTTSFAGFIVGRVLVALAAGLGGGAAIVFCTASAEPAYRERFPRLLSLSSLLRLRALRSREFFLSTLVGVALTFFFFAYENVFYLIANSLGAWAPREVAYSDLLSTAFPWVYVLFFGFLPAISEEFISRMFSIPVFERLFRSTAAAIVVAAFIWGFGHAGYPNQPFWIRGLEVGIAGIIFGLVFLRWGIVSVIVCHFSVDALYTAFVLIRSPNLYYRISGTLSAGFFGMLLLGAAIAYWRKGGFLAAEVTNEAEGVPPRPETLAEPVASAAPESAYVPLPAARVTAVLIAAAVLAASSLLPIAHFGDWVRFGSTKASARSAAAGFLQDNGFEVAAYRSAVEILDRTDSTAAAYLLDQGGLDAAERFYGTLAPTPEWHVRFFVPEQKEEFSVHVDTATGAVVGFDRTIAEDAPGASASPERALAIAEGFLREHGFDPAGGELKEQTAKDEKARRDHTMVFEFPEAGAREAKLRQEIGVQGDAVGRWTRRVKVPEQWRREREKETALTVTLMWLKLPLLGALGVGAFLLLISRIRAGAIPWRFALLAGIAAAAATAVRSALSLDAFWMRYATSIPAGGYVVVLAIGLFIGIVGSFVAAALAAALAGAIFPAAVTMFRTKFSSRFSRDALVGGAAAFGLALGLPTIVAALEALVPAGRLVHRVSWPTGIESSLPALHGAANAVSATILVAAAAAIAAGVLLEFYTSGVARWALGILFVLAFLPATARTIPEYGVSALSLVLFAAGVLGLARFVLRDNPLAWLAGAWLGLGGASAVRLLREPGAYRLHGALLAAVVAIPAAWLLVTWWRKTGSP